MSSLRPPGIEMLARPILRPPLHLTFSFTVSGCNIIRARKLDVQKK